MRGSGVAQGAKAARRAGGALWKAVRGMNTVILAVDNMHCGKCVGNVERRYREMPGVSEVEVDLAGKQARVVFDPEVCRIEDLLGALDDTNFKVARMLDDGSNPFLTTKLELAINGMHCEKCVANIEKRYRETPGCELRAGRPRCCGGVVYYDDSAVDEDALLHVLDDTKFEVVVMPEDGSDPVFPSTARGDDAADGAAGFSGPATSRSKDKALRCLTLRCSTRTSPSARRRCAWPSRGCTARTAPCRSSRFNKTEGVRSCAVNLANNTGVVVFDPTVASVDDMMHVFDDLAFSAEIIPDDAP